MARNNLIKLGFDTTLWDEETCAFIWRQVNDYLGPIAKFLVRNGFVRLAKYISGVAIFQFRDARFPFRQHIQINGEGGAFIMFGLVRH